MYKHYKLTLEQFRYELKVFWTEQGFRRYREQNGDPQPEAGRMCYYNRSSDSNDLGEILCYRDSFKNAPEVLFHEAVHLCDELVKKYKFDYDIAEYERYATLYQILAKQLLEIINKRV